MKESPNTEPCAIRVAKLHRNLKLLHWDAGAWALMNGAAEAYFVAFALAAGLSQVSAGLVATVPVLLGALLHGITPWGVRHAGSLRTWTAGAACVQAISLAGLAACAWTGGISAPMLYGLVTLYWAAGFATAPSWQTWMPTVVPKFIATHFWTARNRTVQACLGLGLLFGLVLQWGRDEHHEMAAFGVLLSVACLARVASTGLLFATGEPQPELVKRLERPSVAQLKRDLGDRSIRSLILYMLAVVFSVQVSGAFFTPYILDELGFEYWQLMCIFAITFLSKVVALPGVGRLAKRHGPGVLLWLGGIGIVPMATLWLVSDSIWWLMSLQFMVGIAWACWETATFLMVFDTIPSDRRTAVLTLYNIAHASAMVTGSLLGATILRFVGIDRAGYAAVFVSTGLMRLMTLFLLAGIEPRRFKLRHSFDLYMQTLGIRLGAGTIDIPQVTETSKAPRVPEPAHPLDVGSS